MYDISSLRVKENIKTLAKESVGLYELKQCEIITRLTLTQRNGLI